MGSSDSRPEAPKRRHFTEVNARLLADQTTSSTNQRPTSTATRVPNYVYQVPRDHEINLGTRVNSSSSGSTSKPSTITSNPRSSSVSNSSTITAPKTANSSMPSSVTTRPFGSTTTSSYNSSSVSNSSTITAPKTANSSMPTRPFGSTTTPSYNSSSVSNSSTLTAPKSANSSMPSTTSSVSTTRANVSPATSSYNSNTLGNNANTPVSRNENSSVKSNASTTPKPLVSTASGSNTSSMNSKFENLDLNNANSTMNTNSTSLGSIGSSQHVNRRNSASNENLSHGNQGSSSDHRRNAYHRRRNNNANEVTETGHRQQFNNRSHSGNRQPRDRNQRPRNVCPSNSRGNNRPNDSGNRQHPRNRTPINVDDRPIENSGDDKTKEVHNAFMKKLVGTFSPNYDKFRGLFCAACNQYELFIGRRPNVKHIDTPRHNKNFRNNPRIKSLSCSSCRIMLHCDIQFLVAHKQSEIHMFIADQKPRSAEVSAEPIKQVDNVVKGDNTLNLKEDIKEKFLQRLDMSPEINDYSFYCHLCEQWFTSHEDWDAHLKNQHDGNDTKVMNMTFRHCQRCKLMMCGSRLLSIFHSDAEEHDKFKTFLSIPSVESDDDEEEEEEEEEEEGDDARDDVSTTSSAAAREQQSQKPVYLVLKNLPPTVTKRDIFAYFKDFGRIENWSMNPIGENTAVVQFRFGSVAENIINSKFPLEIHGTRFDAVLQYL